MNANRWRGASAILRLKCRSFRRPFATLTRAGRFRACASMERPNGLVLSAQPGAMAIVPVHLLERAIEVTIERVS